MDPAFLSLAVRAAIIAACCILLWLTESVPLWAPTILLWFAVPLFLAQGRGDYGFIATLRSSADPVLLLFLAGFTIAAAARRCRLDRWIVSRALRVSRGSPARLVAIAAFTTLGLSMWMSNVAAAALVFGAMQPLLQSERILPGVRSALLLAIALAADFGGIATPIGSGPNGIAMAAVEPVHRIDFLEWMAFGVPLAAALVSVAVVVIQARIRSAPPLEAMPDQEETLSASAIALIAVVAATIGLWLTEGMHGWPAWWVAVGTITAIVGSRLVWWREIRQLDWTTLLLIAGGIGIGRLLERAGTIRAIADRLPLETLPPVAVIFLLCVTSASLSALMSNTGTAAMLIPLAATVDPSPSTAVLIAVAASLGIAFVISTPPNAMAVANGLRSRDLLRPGLFALVGGCAVVALTGPWVLHRVGIP